MEHRLTPLTEGGLLAALTVLMAVMAVYLPVIGLIAALLWPVPVIVLVVRHGLRVGLLATAVATAITAMLIEPMAALRMTIAFAPSGLALGCGYRRRWPAVHVFLAALIAAVFAKIAAIGLMLAVTGIDPFASQESMMEQALGTTTELYAMMGMGDVERVAVENMMKQTMELVKLLIPFTVILMGILDAALNFFIAGRVLRRLGESAPTLPPFEEWQLPRLFLLVFGFSLVGMYWGSTRNLGGLYQASLNAELLAVCAGLVQGVSLLWFAFGRYALSKPVRILISFVLFTNGFLLQVAAFAGLFDMAFDYRRRFGRKG